jgi:phage terminase large subunit-like protein
MVTLDPRRKVVEEPWERVHAFAELPAGERVAALMGELVVPQGRGAGKPFGFRKWQRMVHSGLWSDGVEVAIVSLPRGQGKTGYVSPLVVAACHALAEECPAPFVPLVAASGEDQSKRGALAVVKRYVKRVPELADRAREYSDMLTFPGIDATLAALPSDATALLGLDFGPLAVIDEIDATPMPVVNAMLSALGKRDGARLLLIGSRVPGGTTLDELLSMARDEPSWRVYEWAAPEGCSVLDEAAWAAANPELDGLVPRSTLRQLARTMPEPEFRSYRLNQRTHARGTWIKPEAWDACADVERVVAEGAEITVAFDGSYTQDSSALVACTLAEPRHVFVVDAWEKDEPTWRVPREEVEAAVADVFDRYRVARFVADKRGWQAEIERWAERYGAKIVLEQPQGQPRAGAASDLFYTAVMERTFTHDGDGRLARHVANARTKATRYGLVLTKDYDNSPRKIDLAVCAVYAYQAATQAKPRRGMRVVTLR